MCQKTTEPIRMEVENLIMVKSTPISPKNKTATLSLSLVGVVTETVLRRDDIVDDIFCWWRLFDSIDSMLCEICLSIFPLFGQLLCALWLTVIFHTGDP